MRVIVFLPELRFSVLYHPLPHILHFYMSFSAKVGSLAGLKGENEPRDV